MVEILKELISHRSENPPCDCRGILQYVCSFLKHRSKARVIYQKVGKKKGNIIALFGKPTLLVHAHLDTVPASLSWTQDPFALVRKGNKLYGLGCTDVKGAIAAMLHAAVHCPPKNLMLLFDSDEENGGNECIETFIKSQYCRRITHAMVNEPTRFNIVTAHKGIFIFRFRFSGKSAHASCPEKGSNAIARAAEFIIELQEYGRKIAKRGYHSLTGPTLNIGCISGGTKPNIVPDECFVEVDRRVLPGSDEKKAERELRALLRKHSKHAAMQTIYAAPSFNAHSQFPYKEHMIECGARDARSTVDFWTEAALLARTGIDCVVCGPGSVDQAHIANEYITEHEFVKAGKYYCDLFNML
jgi:acetylornithine deacetylase